ncbi:WD40 repeat-containing protein [Beggiatoa alba B18LD]|uniref:WD40 repeat-containing protein n=1 Tax=Beggiatoa alba B18LD TaxID=395493 RepID=I3CES7_9GAMM|nr:AAA family ATPase [Beggiatoa alba]EIJ42120.1 WD40 repeat-containing protein [Beggiatoa alba B18LD]
MIDPNQQRIAHLQETLTDVYESLHAIEQTLISENDPLNKLRYQGYVAEKKQQKLAFENELRDLGIDPSAFLKPFTPKNPYRGLAFFRLQDHANFFGREQITEDLKARVEKYRFIVLIGASGSGKSSVLQAGLQSVLEDSWLVLNTRPSIDPFKELSHSIIPLRYSGAEQDEALSVLPEKLSKGVISLADVLEMTRRKQDKAQLLLIIDQFEELYTQNTESVQTAFIQCLQTLLQATAQSLPIKLLLAYRADFTGFVIGSFGDLLNKEGALFLDRMSETELYDAIERPALNSGVQLEAGLLKRIVADVGEESGRLPLLQFALSELWEKQANRYLTHQAYTDIGGIEQALAKHADVVLNQYKNQENEIRRIFMQLIRFGEGTADTRQVVTQTRVTDWQLVSELANHRLVITQQDEKDATCTVELIHEALIKHWQPLRAWIDADRKFRVWQEGLRRDMQDNALLRDTRLAVAQEWLNERNTELLAEEKAFIQASIAEKQREEARQLRQKQAWTVAILIFLAVALGLSALAMWKWQESEQSLVQIQQKELEINQKKIEVQEKFTQSKMNQSRMLAGFAEIELNKEHPITAMRLALEALPNASETYPERPAVAEAHDFLVRAMNRQHQGVFEHNDVVTTAIFNPDGKTFLTIVDKKGYIWNVETRQLIMVLSGHTDGVRSATYSPDGKRVVTASDDKTAVVWDAESGTRIATFKHTDSVRSATYSPDGKRVVTASDDKTAVVWDAESGMHIATLEHTDPVWSAMYSPNSKHVVTASHDSTAVVWDAESGTRIATLEHGNFVMSAMYSPNGKYVVTASVDNTAVVWDAKSGTRIATLKHTKEVLWSATFSSDGKRVVTTSLDKTAVVWDAESGTRIATLQHTYGVTSATYSPDNSHIVTASGNGSARLWLVPPDAIAYAKTMLPPRYSEDPRDAGIENFRLTCAERERFFLDEIPRCRRQ